MTWGYKWLGEEGADKSEVSSNMTVSFRASLFHFGQFSWAFNAYWIISMWHGDVFPKNDVKKGKLTLPEAKCQHGELTRALCCHVQEAFFGKDLLDKSKQSRQQGVESGLLEEGQSQVERKHPATSFLDPSSDPLLSASATSLPTRPAAARTYTHYFSSPGQGM